MRCPACTTEVPEARFCARCGERLAEHPAAGATTRHVMRTDALEVPASARAGRLAAVTGGLLAVIGVSAAMGWMTPEAPLDGREVAVPAAGPVEPSVDPPSATVLCSNFSEHRIGDDRLGDAGVGDTVELHGGTCVVLPIDADPGSRLYPRGVARGGRPDTRPPPGP